MILVTGAAGFIGSKTAQMLLEQNISVVGIDDLNDYYDVRLKRYRLKELKRYPNFTFQKINIEQAGALKRLFAAHRFEAVINLAARAGVRYSIENPFIYMTTNAQGTLNLLDLCRAHKIKKFILASTSSLYAGQAMPFKEDLPVNTPISPYAASKKSAEAMAYTYHYLHGLDVSIVRYFTVYGPAGRPDMSLFRFIKWIMEGHRVELFGDGTQSRDFTYVDDIARGTIKALKRVGYEIINLGGGRQPVSINQMISMIETYSGKKARVTRKPACKADMKSTWADISKAEKILGWKPLITFEDGVRKTVEWHMEHSGLVKEICV